MPAERRSRSRPRRRLLACVLAALALVLATDAGWIHAKAALAQVLLARAWAATVADGRAHRPWPWADSHPVAKLVAPRLGIEQVVLTGDNGRVLAFGPGWAEASARPGGAGTVAISGHRDTHFAWLRELAAGDLLRVEARTSRHYRVIATRVADARREHLVLDEAVDRLLLVTCWPFDAVTSGGTARYVVEAVACDECAHDLMPSATSPPRRATRG